MAERPLNAYLPIQSTEVDGVVQPFAPRLSFGVGFEATFVEGTPNKIKIDITPSSVVDLIPDATNASDGLATAEQITMLEDHETRLDDAEAALGVTRTGTVELASAQAWADLGAVLPIAVSTTTFYELSLQASWPDHSHASEIPDDADSVSATVQVAITRNASTGITVEQRNGGTSWDLGRVLFRGADGGSGSWKLQVERADFAADTATTATVTATVRVLSTQAWSGETATSWVSLDGEGSLALGSGTPAAVAAAGSAGASTDAAPFDHVHAHGNQSAGSSLHAAADGSNNGFMSSAHYTLVNGAAVAPTVSTLMKRDTDGTCQAVGLTLVNASGQCTFKATTNGTTAQSLDVLADVVTATFGECIVTATAGFSVAAGSHAQSDASGNYSFTRTNASATTETYQNTVTSVTSSIAQAASGTGGTRTIRAGKGAATQAGGTATLAGGDGGSSTAANGRTILGAESHNTGTALAGDVCAILGSPVSNVTARMTCESTPGTVIWQTYQYSSTSIASRAGPGDGVATSGLKTWDLCANAFNLRAATLCQIISGTSSYVFGVQKVWNDAPEVTNGDGSTDYKKDLRIAVTVSSATTSNGLSYTTASNRGYRFRMVVVAYNATDTQIGSWCVEGACRNIAGTLTQVGATTALGTTFEDAAQTGLDATVDVSGTAIRARCTNDGTDTVRFRGILELWEVA